MSIMSVLLGMIIWLAVDIWGNYKKYRDIPKHGIIGQINDESRKTYLYLFISCVSLSITCVIWIVRLGLEIFGVI